MEYLKVGCTTFIRPYLDRPDIRCPIRYVRVPRTNPTFTLPTIFGFDEYTKDGVDPVYPGVEFGFKWASGPVSLFPFGVSFCGTPEQWERGCLTTDPAPSVNPATGRFACCGGGALMVRGGEAHGGMLMVPAPFLQVLGGEAHGGASFRVLPPLPRGGEAHGGNLARVQWFTPIFAGGEAHGGLPFGLGFFLVTGGEAHGGAIFSFTATADGGEAHGGLPVVTRGSTVFAGGEAHGGFSLWFFMEPPGGGTGHGGVPTMGSAAAPAGGAGHGGVATTSQPSIAVVQQTPLTSTAGGQNSVQTPFTSAPPTLGNKLVVLVWTFNTNDDDPATYTVTDNLGNTYTLDIGNTMVASPCAVFSAPVTHAGGAAQVTVQFPGGHTGYLNACLVEISGVPSNVTEASAQGGSGGAVNTIQTPPITTTHPGCILFSIINTSSGMTAVTVPPGWTQIAAELSGNVHEDGACSYLILSGTITGIQYTWNWNTVSGVNDVIVAYRPG